MLDNSDDYDFKPSNSSKLASLFGNVSINDPNNSLVYKAPKPPGNQNIKKIDDSNASTSVISGKVVLLWKLENNDYAALGKHGLAIIGSSDRNVFEMIGYKEKTNIIFRIRLNTSFVFYNQKDHFSTFYDANLVNWLIKFEGNDQEEFTRILESHDVQITRSQEETQSDTNKKPILLQKPAVINEVNDDKGDSLSDSSGSKQRANILNRMAKMGQAILPRSELKNTSTDLSDFEIEEQKQERRIPPRQVKRVTQEKALKQITISQSNMETKLSSEPTTVIDKYQQPPNNEMHIPQIIPNNQVVYGPPQLYNPQMVPSQMFAQSWANESYTQFIITQNTELKMNLAQITAKLDTILNTKKTDPDQDADRKSLMTKLKTMKLKTENLETALQKSETKYSILKSKYEELEGKLQDMSGIDSKNKEIETLENTVSQLKTKLKESQEKSDELQSEVETFHNKVKDLVDDMNSQKNVIKEYNILEEKNKSLEMCNLELTETIKSQCGTIEDLKLKLKDFEDHFEKIEAEKKEGTQISNTKIKTIDDLVKRHMNDMYQSILDNFEEQGSYSFSDVRASVAKNLKMTSFNIIKDCVNIFKDKNILDE